MKNRIAFVISCIFAASFCAAQTTPASSYRQEGIASWYGNEFEGRPTASGELFDPKQFTAAHPDLPFGTLLIVTNMLNGEQVVVRVNDRGPFRQNRILDVSKAAAEKLNMIEPGTAQVIVELAPRNAVVSDTQANTEAASPVSVSESAPASSPVSTTPQTVQANQNDPANQASGQPAVTNQPLTTPQTVQANQSAPANQASGQPAVTNQPLTAPQTVQANQSAPANQASGQPAVTSQNIQPPATASRPLTQRNPPANTTAPATTRSPAPTTRASSGATGTRAPTAPSYTPQQPSIAQNPSASQTQTTRTSQSPSSPQTNSRTQSTATPSGPVASFQPVPTIARPPVAAPGPAPTMPNSALAPSIPPASAQPSTRSYPSYTSADITGGPFVNGRYYRLQIGSFRVAKNAVEVFDRLSAAGLNPQWEPFGELYRVVISNVRAEDIGSIAARLGAAGFSEAIAREER